jgi:acetyl esterase/lipase
MNIETNMDPELLAVFAKMPQSNPEDVTIEVARAIRNRTAALAASRPKQPKNQTICYEDRDIHNPVDNCDVPVRIYTPLKLDIPRPGILNIHGGGFIQGDLETDDLLCAQMSDTLGCVVLSIDYRLAPEFPYPAALNDCYSVLKWMSANAKDIGVDRNRIGIRGGSAGGGLAAGLTLMARDRHQVNIHFQMLLSPCLDHRHLTQSSNNITDNRTFSRQMSLTRWKAYLGGIESEEVPPYAAPILASDLSNLPPAYIMVGELEVMRDENIEYASRLMQSGVSTELHVYAGAFHGFNVFVPDASISIQANAEIEAALRRFVRRIYLIENN